MGDDDWDIDTLEKEAEEKKAKEQAQKDMALAAKGSAAKLFGDADLAAVDTENTDFIDIFGPDKTVDFFILDDEKLAILARAITESSEGSVRDRLFNYGFELSDVDTIVSYVQKFLASNTSTDVGGQYFSGEAKDLLDPETLGEVADLFGGGKDDKKANKKSKAPASKKYNSPVEEVYSMLIEGQRLPIIYVQQFVVDEAGYNALLALPGLKATEYYVFFDEENMKPEVVADIKARFLK